MNQAKKFPLIFSHKEAVAPGIVSFYFTPPKDFHYLAGQYLQMLLPHPTPDDSGSGRFFTIASAPDEKQIMITSRAGRTTFKDSLFQLQPGESVSCFGPIGTFVLEEEK